MTNHKLPIFSPMNGRDVIGFASGIRSATSIIRGLITVDPRCTLHVWQRSKCFIDMTDVLEMPDGFCYAISYKY